MPGICKERELAYKQYSPVYRRERKIHPAFLILEDPQPRYLPYETLKRRVIIALSDVLATGAIAGIRAAGLSVPEDIRVAGCDGNPLAWSGAVSLTTCAPAGYEMGRKGVQLLVEMIEAEQEPQASHVRLGNRVQSPRTEDHPTRRIETVRPFLLERASTRGAAATTSSAHRSPQVPETNLGAYL